MISIIHPQVTTKPPINKYCSGKKRLKEIKILPRKNNKIVEENEDELKNEEKNNHEIISDKIIDGKKICNECNNFNTGNNLSEDINQNLIDNNCESSFDKLCCMIDDLEKNSEQEHQVLSVKTCFLPTEEIPVTSNVDQHDQPPLNAEPEQDKSKACFINEGSTYDDIMTFLNTLEEDCSIPEFLNIENQLQNDNKLPREIEEFFIHKNNHQIISNNLSGNEDTIFTKIRDDQLATALLKLEDREATLKILKEELKNERKVACEKLKTQTTTYKSELQNQKIKYQNIIKRHQKFIEQLIDEKKVLSEKCNLLGQKIKEIEIKQQKDIKILLDRHVIELQRARELCLAGEKIRRERWLEAKTSKIREMTVKGLEPELRSINDQHQQEIQEIRSVHMKELQEVELRAIRRSNQQLEQLRIELTASHDKILINEKDAIRKRFQIKYDEQENHIQEQQRKFFQQIESEKKKYHDELVQINDDNNLAIKNFTEQFQEKIEQLKRQNEIEKKTMREAIENEKEVWMENNKRQDNIKLNLSETKIRAEANKERDRQIELAIDRFEKETNDMKINLQRATDNKLKCLKDKYESELQVSRDNEKLTKEKLLLLQEKYDELAIKMEKTESKFGKCLADFNEETRMVEKLTRERDHAKKLARQEIEHEKRELENKISSLYKEITDINANRDSHMTQLYSRIKLIITQKDVTIKNITNDVNDFKNKCEHLEKMLDQQRKDYVLKTL